MDLAYLTALTCLECQRPGFESIEPGALLPLRVVTEEVIREGERRALDGSLRKTTARRKEMLIELTAPDGTRHHFHTDPADIPTFTDARRQPAGRVTVPVKHHPIDTFVRFFHVPLPPGVPGLTKPQSHCLLDLLTAITAAAQKSEPA